ncbi:NAD(P)-binding protein [Myriangium duriaei CBS 260.36]|uniref:NAD(P)-binding protein n=1 Tax=Myriangium duriaei CBS 260.36 TaxID=1168546 RepID=A0A9P4IT66_9PEZI|nr:NAD(P)-binding protein [Myriangium duriaei CBS 260.36]
MSIKNVVLVGADGKLGPSILQGLVAEGFKVTVFKRAGSKSPSDYPSSVSVVRIKDEFPVDELTKALQGQDAIVVTTAGSQVEVQKRLAEAGANAGVKRFIPADFGSCDSSMDKVQELVPLYIQKSEIRDYLTNLANKNDKFSWTSIVPGHFFDWSLEFLHLWIKEKRGDILDDGETKFSIATLAQVARATAAVLKKPNETINKIVYVQSFCINQNELVKAVEKATDSKWTWTHLKSDDFEREKKPLADKGDHEAIEDLVWYLGTLYSNWESKDNFAMDLLGLKNEDLNEAMKKAVAQETA